MEKEDELDLAWLAGFFEGEGCIHIGKNKHSGWQGSVTLFQRNEACLLWVLDVVERLSLPKPRWTGAKGYAFFSPGLQWTGYSGAALLRPISPYFHHPDKIACADLYCKFYNPEESYGKRQIERPELLAEWKELRCTQKQIKEAFEAKCKRG